MEENTTTGAPSDDTGANQPQTINGIAVDEQGNALPVTEDATEAPAVAETTENEATETSTEAGAQEEALPVSDDKLAKFAKGQGIDDISQLSKRELGLLKSAYDTKVEFTQNRQQAGQLEKSMTEMSDESAEEVAAQTGQDPNVLKRLQRMEVKESIRDFWTANPDARQYESEMTKIAQEAGLFGSPEAILKASYAMAVANDQSRIKSEGARDALQNLAHTQQAAVPGGKAVNSVPTDSGKITPQNVDRMVAAMSVEEYQKRLPEINAALAGH